MSQPAPQSSPDDLSRDAPPSPPPSLPAERLLAYLLIAAALVACALKVQPGPALLHAPVEDTLARLLREWGAGEHRALAALGVLLGLASLGCCGLFLPRLVRDLGAARRAPPWAAWAGPGLALFLIGAGTAIFVQALVGALFLGSERPQIALPGEPPQAVGAGLSLAPDSAGEPSLIPGRAADAWAYLSAGASAITVEAGPSGPPLALSDASVASLTSENATPLAAGRKGTLSPHEALWAGGRALSVSGPGLRPILVGATLGGVLGALALVTVLAGLSLKDRVEYGGASGDARGSAGGGPAGIGLTQVGVGREVGRGLTGYLAVLPLLLALSFLTQALATRLGIPAEHHPFIKALERDWGLAVWVVLAAGVAAPLVEELIFRGLALSALQRALGVLPALGAQALLFAAVHPGFSHLLPMLCLGTLFGALRLTSPSGSLVAPITAHMAHNGLTLGFVLCVLA